MNEVYKALGVSENVLAFSETILSDLKDRFAAIDAIAEANQLKVIAAMQKNRVAANHFNLSTGYGYDDEGRDTLERVYADCFGAEAALVRPQITCGTHALAVALSANLLPGDELRLCILQLLLRRGDLRRALRELCLPGLIRLHERLDGVPSAEQLRLIELLLRRHTRPEQRGLGQVAACDRRVILRLPVEIALIGRVHRIVHRLDLGELRLPGGVFLLRRGKFLLPGGIVGLALLELRLPGGILRFGRGELLAAGVILRLPALEPALADVIRHDARGKRELERVIRLLLLSLIHI